MTYVVTDERIKCKYLDCIEICPVDCFYEGENIIVINTEECIDCAVCEPECLVDAIKPDTILDATKWIAFNQKYSEIWPNISEKSEPMINADYWADVPDKMVHLSKNLAQQ